MKRERITKRVVEALAGPTKGSAFLWDTEVPGFAVRVHRAKDRTWRAYVVRFSVGGKDRWVTIGEHGCAWRPDPRTGRPRVLTAELAREEALRYRGIWQAGGDPREVRQRERVGYVVAKRPDCPTVEEFSRTYLDKHSDLHKATASAKKDRWLFQRYILPALGSLRLDDVGPGQIADLQAKLRKTPVTANRCLSLISHTITLARRWGALPRQHDNPCTDQPRFKEKGRERFLSAPELKRLGPALVAEKKENLHAVAAILVLAFTGARPSEILSLEREQLHLERGHVMVKRKGRWLPIYLPPPAVLILRDLPEKKGNPYVFPAEKSNGPMTTQGPLRDVWRRVRLAAKLDGVRMYDLRHTLASMAVNTGYSLEVIGGLLGHTNSATTKRYAHLQASPVKEAGTKVARQIAAALKG